MGKITISVVITVLNEADSIHALIESLLNQTRLPDELVVVDGGSTDDTLKLVNEHKVQSPFPIKLISAPKANRSQGRNKGIEAASYDYIAVIDGGCEADDNWLEHLEEGFNKGHDAVAGFYLPSIERPIQKFFVPFLAVSPQRLDAATFLPSSRSLGFTKDAWEAAGKYPEHLPTCEDLVFASKLKAKASMVVQTNAMVYWHLTPDLWGFFRVIANYAYGDVLAGYRRHLYKILTMWCRYILFLIFPLVFFGYILYRCWNHRVVLTRLTTIPWYVVTMLVADAGVMWGSLRGLIALLIHKNTIGKVHA